jgi:DNA-binding NarL/FixJ family response regulator
MASLNVIIADNQSLSRIGTITVLSKFFNEKIKFSEVETKEGLLNEIAKGDASVLIIDYQLFDFSELKEMVEIQKKALGLGVLILSDNQNAEDISKLVDWGFSNYLLKKCTEHELIEAFNSTLNSKKYFSSEILDILFEKKSQGRLISEQGKLTSSETEIVRMIAQGLTTKEIASRKFLSFHTIITHRKNIFRKLGITNSSELLMYAIRNGILESTEYYI